VGLWAAVVSSLRLFSEEALLGGRTDHEVESGHEQDHVRQNQPVILQSKFRFLLEHLGRILVGIAGFLSFLERLRLRQTQAEDDNENRRTGAEPEELQDPIVSHDFY
jgi:hypothetical protein